MYVQSVYKRVYAESCGIRIYYFCRSAAYSGTKYVEKQRLCKFINDRFLIKTVVR
jgi:hypothetical protein